MTNITAYQIILSVCGIVVLSYVFSLISRATRIPSVLMLLGFGMLMRYLAIQYNIDYKVPEIMIETLGTVGLIMIVLEAGLDLEISKNKIKLIRNSFSIALIIFVLSTISIAYAIQYKTHEDFIKCLIYAIPLSIVSSAIVLPSVGHLSSEKREFLIYEASFSDVIGIMAFNYFLTDNIFTLESYLELFGGILFSVVISVLFCLVLMYILLKNKVNVRFFLLFSVLIMIYILGKMVHLPSLLVILIFGLVVNNWNLVKFEPLTKIFNKDNVLTIRELLHSITMETSFLIRTFFFIIFGFSIDISLMQNWDVIVLGSMIVMILLCLRYIYLRILHHYNLLPELFYIPRGLITILLFYKIPPQFRMENFSEGVLFFVILTTSVIMMLGSILFNDKPVFLHNVPDDDVRLLEEKDQEVISSLY